MSTDLEAVPIEAKLATVATGFALAMSLAAAYGLAVADIASAKKLRASRVFATEVPMSGALAGQNALDNSEWAPRDGGEQEVVLFVVAANGELGDINFWRDVSSRSVVAAPGVEFVGLCRSGTTCFMPPDAGSRLTLLTSMDPSQMSGLAMADRQHSALVYRGAEFKDLLPIQRDPEVLSAEIARALGVEISAGGV